MIYIPNRSGSRNPGAMEPRHSNITISSTFLVPGVGGGTLRNKLAGGMRPTSQNPYPVYDCTKICDFSYPHGLLIYDVTRLR